MRNSSRPEYGVWSHMKQRCYNPTRKDYRLYGGRGITVCDRWRNSFANFYKDMGDRPKGLSLDRIDSDQDYHPNNCRWADYSTQMHNRRAYNELGIKGIYRQNRRFYVRIMRNGTLYISKYFLTIELAKQEYDRISRDIGYLI